MENNLVLRVVVKFLLPFALLFAFYVHWHGDFSPGGGFQAGVIFAASIILYALIFGLPAAQRVVPQPLVETLVPLGVLIYGGTGVVNMLLGGNFLDYNSLDSHNPAHGQHYGILLVELGVLVTVAGVMLAIFYFFAGRRRGAHDMEDPLPGDDTSGRGSGPRGGEGRP